METGSHEPLALLRTLQDIRTIQGASFALEDGMPSGPWRTDVVARQELDAWCQNLNTASGGWAIRWASKWARRSNRGVQRVLQCFREKIYKCKWQLDGFWDFLGLKAASLFRLHESEVWQGLYRLVVEVFQALGDATGRSGGVTGRSGGAT
jgi:hypothetical protein